MPGRKSHDLGQVGIEHRALGDVERFGVPLNGGLERPGSSAGSRTVRTCSARPKAWAVRSIWRTAAGSPRASQRAATRERWGKVSLSSSSVFPLNSG